ncbi:MAG: YraN family protein [Flavobacteriales bacterium]|nr:YraN family protein [Flavobacteriales bacterium]
MTTKKRNEEVSKAYTLGVIGENEATDYLLKKGYSILGRRVRVSGIEIDIIAMDDDVLVFVEVKTRSTDFFASPESAVDLKKQHRMICAADYYARANNINAEVRFDIIAIVQNADTKNLKHIKGAFSPFV